MAYDDASPPLQPRTVIVADRPEPVVELTQELRGLISSIKRHTDSISATVKANTGVFPRNSNSFPEEDFSRWDAIPQLQYLTHHLLDRFNNKTAILGMELEALNSICGSQERMIPQMQRNFRDDEMQAFFSSNPDLTKTSQRFQVIPRGHEAGFSWEDLLDLFAAHAEKAAISPAAKKEIHTYIEGMRSDFTQLLESVSELCAIEWNSPVSAAHNGHVIHAKNTFRTGSAG